MCTLPYWRKRQIICICLAFFKEAIPMRPKGKEKFHRSGAGRGASRVFADTTGGSGSFHSFDMRRQRHFLPHSDICIFSQVPNLKPK
ncbi:unnamed protein product [Allacma fusca]|uniref:Uncharacterized protein n=1 Tax=Allacma fusca TaxID=39272 RepID=A0A8J2JLG9_9HEXA|nr:unnamed protein product [Allacma fusca]